jgi:predicted transcriptional regulator
MKSDLKNFLVDADCSIRTVATKLELHGLGAAFAIKNKVLVGVITDSDLRRLLLKEVPLDSPLHNHLNNDYLAVKSDESILKYRDIINKKGIEIIPVVNSAGNLVDIINVNETNNHRHQNTIIVMAGGLGSRMGAMTNKCPKPMLEVAGKPIIAGLSKSV